MSWLLLLLLPILIPLYSGCGKKEEKLPTTSDTVSVPYQDMEKSVMYFYDKGLKRWMLEAEHVRKDLDPGAKSIVTPVRLTLYDSSGETSTRVWADSGSTQGTMDNFLVWGDVLVKTDNHMTIRTQKLWWNKNTHKVNSDTYVQIETATGDILRGKGLDAWEDFSTWSLKQNVTGKFPDFKDRMEKDEEIF